MANIYGRNVLQDLANLSDKPVSGIQVGRLAQKYSGHVEARRQREAANEREVRLNIPHMEMVKQRIAEELQREAEKVNGALPVSSVYDAYALVKSAKTRDAGVSALQGQLESMWKRNRSGSLTADTYLKLHDHYKRNYPKSAAADLIQKIGQQGYATLPVSELEHIASKIASQEDFDYAIIYHGLNGNLPHQVKSRRYLLALLNEDEGDEEMSEEQFVGQMYEHLEDMEDLVEEYADEEGFEDPEGEDDDEEEEEEDRGGESEESPFSGKESRSKRSDFMKPEVVEGEWYEVETSEGLVAVPAEFVGVLGPDDDFEEIMRDYVGSADIFGVETIPHGYGARMSAPGYMDSTDWTVFDKEEDAWDYLEYMFEDEDVDTESAWEEYYLDPMNNPSDRYKMSKQNPSTRYKMKGRRARNNGGRPFSDKSSHSKRRHPSVRAYRRNDEVPPCEYPGVIETLFSWYGGQGDDIYALASSWYAGNSVPVSIVEGALGNLESDLEKISGDPGRQKDADELAEAIDMIGYHLSELGIDLEEGEDDFDEDRHDRSKLVQPGELSYNDEDDDFGRGARNNGGRPFQNRSVAKAQAAGRSAQSGYQLPGNIWAVEYDGLGDDDTVHVGVVSNMDYATNFGGPVTIFISGWRHPDECIQEAWDMMQNLSVERDADPSGDEYNGPNYDGYVETMTVDDLRDAILQHGQHGNAHTVVMLGKVLSEIESEIEEDTANTDRVGQQLTPDQPGYQDMAGGGMDPPLNDMITMGLQQFVTDQQDDIKALYTAWSNGNQADQASVMGAVDKLYTLEGMYPGQGATELVDQIQQHVSDLHNADMSQGYRKMMTYLRARRHVAMKYNR